MEKPYILIVDDRPENLLSLSAMLDGLDINIISACSGNEALTLIQQHDFALVLLDVQMPDMDGFEVAELIRSRKKPGKYPLSSSPPSTRIRDTSLKAMQLAL